MTGPVAFRLPPSPDEAAEAQQLELAREEASRRARERAAVAWRAVPPAFDRMPPELIDRCAPALRAKLAAMGNPTLSALLLGPTGCGKTSAAACLLRRALALHCQTLGREYAAAVDVCWTTAAALSTSEREHPLGDGKPKLLQRASEAGCLVLDDLGNDAIPAPVFQVLSTRYDWQRPTIATTGLTRAELTSHLKAAGVRRLAEQHAGWPVLIVDCHDKAARGRG